MAKESSTKIVNTTGNPAPLGLMGFGMSTVLLNFHNIGAYPLDAMVLSMGLFYGGVGQIIAGIMEWKKNNTFGTTAFTSYGLFWLTLVFLIMAPKIGLATAASNISMGYYLGMWGIFTAFLWIDTIRLSKALEFVFASLTLLFFLLSIGNLTSNPAMIKFAGYVGIICGFSAIYTALAQVLNGIYGRIIFPLGQVNK